MSGGGDRVIRVGSRKSELALIQTRHVITTLEKHHPILKFEIVTMSTLGDKILDVPLPKIGEKSLFTKELEAALETGAVDFVVHSLKDLPTTLPNGMVIGAVLEREDPRDALVLRHDLQDFSLETLPKGSTIGTSSLRRTAQLAKKYPHLKVESIRGNLNTRLKKLDELGSFEGIVLAAAGLQRMGWAHRISKILEDDELLYAVGQGALAVECRGSDQEIIGILEILYNPQTALRVIAERSFLKTLGGGCSAPVAVTTDIDKRDSLFGIKIKGAVWSLDGKQEIVDVDQSEVEIKNYKRCIKCPQNNSKTDDIECLKDCSYKRSNTDRINNTGKRQKLDNGDTNLLQTDPHEHCPVSLPVGADFMGKCPYLETHNFAHTQNLTDVSKCPFIKEEFSLQNLDKDAIQPTTSSNGVKSYVGLAPHSNIPQWAMDEVVNLGIRLANKLIKNGAVKVMAEAQSFIRGVS